VSHNKKGRLSGDPRHFSRTWNYFGTVVVPLLVLPRGPVTVPLIVLLVPLFVVVPFTVVVPPLGPVTDPDSAVPPRVRVTLPFAEAVLPRAPVAEPEPLTVAPVRLAEPVAVLPCLPVTVFCACAPIGSIRVSAAAAVIIPIVIFLVITSP
jgi:hypothetical protein